MKRIAAYILLLSGLMALWVGCAHDGGIVPGEQQNIPVRFTLDVPNTFQRSLILGDDEQVDNIDVLAFVWNGTDYTYTYRRQGKNYSPVTKSFTVDLIGSSIQQILVVLVNSRDEVDATAIPVTDNIEAALSRITIQNDAEWPAKNDVAETFRAIPMAGISAGTVISKGMGEIPVTLYRMLARVNITLAQSVGNFQIHTAQVFNRTTEGYVGYKPSYLNSSAWVPTDNKEYLPSFIYEADNNGEIINQIYIFEAKGVTSDDRLKSTAIVIGGTLAGDSTPSYYRVDLTPNGLLGTSARDILRNYSYNIEVQAVSIRGAESARDAYEGVISLSAEVKTWTPNNSNIIVDGQYYLKLSQSTIAIGSMGNVINITAETNYDADPYTGYAAGIRLDTDYMDSSVATVTMGSNTGSGNIYRHNIAVNVTDNPGTGTRWTPFFIKAGNMSHQMAIWQWSGIWLSVSNWQASYAPGNTRYTLAIHTIQWRNWEITAVEDPDSILMEGSVLIGHTGGGGGSGTNGDEKDDTVYFYVRSGAQSGKTATIVFTNTNGDNPPVRIEINTPN